LNVRGAKSMVAILVTLVDLEGIFPVGRERKEASLALRRV